MSKSSALMITSDTVRYLASYIDQSATLYKSYIKFGSGYQDEKLLEVPLMTEGQVNPRSTIRVTVGLEDSSGGSAIVDTDNSPRVGIEDGVYSNVFELKDAGTCHLYSGEKHHEGPMAVDSVNVTAQYELIFTPFYRFGACSSAKNGGYVSSGVFKSQIDLTKHMNLVVFRSDAHEEYSFSYFLVEIIQ